MTTKTLTGAYPAGYTLGAGYSGLIIDASAYVGGSGVYASAAASIVNYGTVNALGGYRDNGVHLAAGGSLTNGAATNTTATIVGYVNGVLADTSSAVANFATISGLLGAGVSLAAGGSVTNGSASSTTALIEGVYGGVQASGAAGTVANFATIYAQPSDVHTHYAIYLEAGGAVTNGSSSDRAALIGGGGVYAAGAPAAIANYGTIQSPNYTGVVLEAGGTVTNGSVADKAALIEGVGGVDAYNAAATVINFGKITGSNSYGVYLSVGGTVTNGSSADTKARIAGFGGVGAGGAPATIANFGTIQGFTNIGVYPAAGGSVTNGSAGDSAALIEGYGGVYCGGAAAPTTVTNFGTITGTGDPAVDFTSTADVLVAEAGSVFNGAVKGGGGTLDLGSGTGTITSLASGDVTVTGSMPTTTFTNFGTLVIAAYAAFTLTSPGTIGAGGTQTLGDLGVLTVSDGLTVDGGAITGATSGAGTLALTGGTTSFSAGSILDVANVTLSGAGTVAAFDAPELIFAGTWSQSAGTLTVGAGDRVSFLSGFDNFAGTFAGAGTVAVVGTFGTLDGTASAFTNRATVVLTGGGFLTLEGELDNSGSIVVGDGDIGGFLQVAGVGVTLTGGGIVNLGDGNFLVGDDSTATLTNVDNKIVGAGFLGAGQLILVNEAGGIINADGAQILSIESANGTVVNAGTIEATGAGGGDIAGVTDNTGKLKTFGGILTLEGPVTGSGIAVIVSGAMDFNSSFSQNVHFNGSTGTLKLGQSQGYGGTIYGFSTAGGTSLDLADIAASGATASFSGNARRGVLTVKSGTETTTIKLIGDYLNTTFTLAGDGHGGTTVTDTAAPPVHAPAHAFIAAMAGLGGHDAALAHPSLDSWRQAPQMLSAPGTRLA